MAACLELPGPPDRHVEPMLKRLRLQGCVHPLRSPACLQEAHAILTEAGVTSASAAPMPDEPAAPLAAKPHAASLTAAGSTGGLHPSASRVKKAFNLWDKDHSGSICGAELQKALAALGMEAGREGTQAVMQKYDVDGDGSLGLAEFSKLVRELANAKTLLKVAEEAARRLSHHADTASREQIYARNKARRAVTRDAKWLRERAQYGIGIDDSSFLEWQAYFRAAAESLSYCLT